MPAIGAVVNTARNQTGITAILAVEGLQYSGSSPLSHNLGNAAEDSTYGSICIYSSLEEL